MSDALTIDNSNRLEAIAVEIETIQGVALLKIGERLCEARELFKYSRDENGFTGWIERRLSFGSSTAYKLIDVFRAFGAESFHKVETLPKSVLYALAAPSTPQPVRDEAMRRVGAGEAPSLDDVMELKRQLVDAKDASKAAKQDVKVQKSEAQRAKDERDRVRNELDFANARIRQQADEIDRLKQDNTIHVYHSEPEPAPAKPAPVAEPRSDCLRTLAEIIADRFRGDIAEIVALAREERMFAFASELEAASDPVRSEDRAA